MQICTTCSLLLNHIVRAAALILNFPRGSYTPSLKAGSRRLKVVVERTIRRSLDRPAMSFWPNPVVIYVGLLICVTSCWGMQA